MKVFNSGSYGRGVVFVSPGADHPERTDWLDSKSPSGKEPRMFTVKFVDGAADVDGDLGRYMIAQGLAQKNPVRLRPEVVAQNAEVDRLKRENAALSEKLTASKLLLTA